MTDLTKQERDRIAAALERDVARLQGLVNDYKTARGNTRNVAVRAMADEGAANMTERIAELRGLVAKLRAEETTGK